LYNTLAFQANQYGGIPVMSYYKPLSRGIIMIKIACISLICFFFGFSVLPHATDASVISGGNQDTLSVKHVNVNDGTDKVKSRLSTLWAVVMFNMLAADVFSLYIPGIHEEMLETAGSEDKISDYMLGGAIMAEIPISMIFLSRELDYTVNRWGKCRCRRDNYRICHWRRINGPPLYFPGIRRSIIHVNDYVLCLEMDETRG
jgi:hypothetical protein